MDTRNTRCHVVNHSLYAHGDASASPSTEHALSAVIHMTARGEDAAAQAEAASAFSPSASATAPAELPLSTDAPTANLAFPSVAGSCRGRDMCRPAFSASAAAPVVASQTVDSQCCHTRVGRGYAKETEGDGVKERASGREREGQRQGEKERVEVEGETSRGKEGAGGRRGDAAGVCMCAALPNSCVRTLQEIVGTICF